MTLLYFIFLHVLLNWILFGIILYLTSYWSKESDGHYLELMMSIFEKIFL